MSKSDILMKRKIRGLLIMLMCITVLASCKKQDEINNVDNKVENRIQNKVEEIKETNKVEIKKDEKELEKQEEEGITPVLMDVKKYCDETKWGDFDDLKHLWWGEKFIGSRASSTLKYEGDIDYWSENIHDFDLSTVWVEGDEGNGVGENIEFSINEFKGHKITNIDIINGYIKSDSLWEANSRVKKLKVWLDEKYYVILLLEDSKKVQRFMVPEIELNNRKKLKFEILEVYEGSKYQDVAITEIQFGEKTSKNDAPKILAQGTYEFTMILPDGSEGIFPHIVQNDLIINVKFTKPANRTSVEEAFENEFEREKEQAIEYKWIDDQNLNIHLPKLEPGEYSIHLTLAKDSDGMNYMEKVTWADSENIFWVVEQNNIATMDIKTKGVSDDIDVSFPDIFYYPKSVSPYSENYVYYDHYDNDPRFENEFRSMIYDKENGWVSISNNKVYDEYEGDEFIWLNEDLVYIRDDIFNIRGELIRTLDLEGNIVGAKSFLDKSEIAVFASEIDEPLNLYIFDSNCNQLIQTIKMPFTYRCNYECNRTFLTNLKCFWIDNESMLVEGCGEEEIAKDGYMRETSLYKVNTTDETVEIIKQNTQLKQYIGQNKVLIEDGVILDVKDKEKTQQVPFLQDINGDDIYHYENYVIYIKDDDMCFYDISKGVEEHVKVGQSAFILGIKDGEIYFNRG